jgi:alkanesulfonate monooxygenase SsuD/methylene tetrahydromethanopterin reductase-like flavin-dependent oxidoreductase (luciferase family)
MTGKKGWSCQQEVNGPVDNAGQRLMHFALERDVHDERLWMPIARATGALGNTSCLVGTSVQVAEALLKYCTLGVDSFLIRGFGPASGSFQSIAESTDPGYIPGISHVTSDRITALEL